MRILVLGGNGMLGHKLFQVLGRDFEVFTTIRREFLAVERFAIFEQQRTLANLDATSEKDLVGALEKVRPDVVINCVGIIKQIDSTPERMVQINTLLPRRLARLSAELSFRLISISTDCVFSGTKGNYTETDTADAHDPYGRSKRAGEVTGPNCLTVRTSIIGRELDTSHSLVEWFLSKRGSEVGGYVNAIYSGFPTLIFAEIVARLIRDHPDLSGLYHISSDPISKFDLLDLVNKAYDANVELAPDPSLVIDRSLDSAKFRTATGFIPESWNAMIERMAADPTAYDGFRKA
ncbi:MAG: SDR family oxidoreductase [Pyrinomonadaceae bacterium]